MNVPTMSTIAGLILAMRVDAERVKAEAATCKPSKYSRRTFQGGIRESDVSVEVREMGESISIHGARAGRVYLHEEKYEV